MDTLSFDTIKIIARIIAVFYATLAVGLLLNGDYYKREFAKLLDNFGFIFIEAFWAFIIGCTIVYCHNVWVMDWPLLITLFGWAGLIKGIVLIAFPSIIVENVKTVFQGDNFDKMLLPPLLIMIALFGYLGFFVS